MIELTCDRCGKSVEALWEVALLFEELEFGEQHDAETGDVTAHVCQPCTEALEKLLARECQRPEPDHEK